MAEAVKEATTKKRQAKPGTRRVTVNLSESEYTELVKVSQAQMREPNNMLSFMLAGRIVGMLNDYKE
jgi:hypothetical protein